MFVCVRVCARVTVCVCVCVREREKVSKLVFYTQSTGTVISGRYTFTEGAESVQPCKVTLSKRVLEMCKLVEQHFPR